MTDRHPRACRAPGCHHLAPTGQPLCLWCQHNGRLPARLGAWAWRQAARRALAVVACGISDSGYGDETPSGLDRPDGWRPDTATFSAALRRVARCYRGAAYAVEASRGFGERAT